MKTTHITFFTMALMAALTIGARAATVTATIDPPDISLGDSAQLTVTITGSQAQADVPTVAGLDIEAIGQSSQIVVNNGAVSVNASTTYLVKPEREGNFTIPAIRVAGASSQPVSLRVGKGNGAAATQNLPPPSIAPAQRQGPVVMPAPGSSPAPDAVPATAQGRYGWIQVTMPKKELYVGELVPVEVKVYIPDIPFEVRELPQLNGEGISLGQLGTKPGQSREAVGGRPYTVLTWNSSMTAVKTGDYPLQLKMPLVVSVPVQMPRMDADDFNNFFQNAFAAMGQRKEVTITNASETVKILPLPSANRPADFSGAIGQFQIEASATPTQVSAGDPITLRLRVTGKGNFDRVASNELPADANWKAYTPKSSFEPADSVGYEGTKTFEQPVIPNDSSITSIPSVTFSFFNPETRQYVTRTAPPIAISVSGSTRTVASVASSAAISSAPPSVPAASGGDLAMNKFESGMFFSTLQPVYLNPAFLAAQAVPLLALVGGMFLVRRRRSGIDAQRAKAQAARQALRQQVDAMDEAIKNHQTHAFFISARAALQHRFGQEWGVRPETITVNDVRLRLGGAAEPLCPIFELADQVSYSALHIGEADLAQWRAVVMNELAEKI